MVFEMKGIVGVVVAIIVVVVAISIQPFLKDQFKKLQNKVT